MRRALELNRRNFLAGAGISAVAALAGSRRLAAASLAGATEVGLLESRFGAIGDGKHDDTKALQASQQLGRPIRLTDGAVYRVTRRIDISDGGGFVGNGTATIYAPADAFDNRDVTIAGRYGTRSAVLSCSGMKRPPFTPRRRPTLRGIAIKSDPVPGRVVDAVVAQNVVDLRIEKVEILGFPVGCGVRAASLSGDSRIVANNIHDFYDDTVWPPHVLPQITAIEIDNDLVAHRASDSVRIEDNRIANVVVGPHFIAAHGNQSDGINIASWDARRTFIRGNRIDNVGEGIDNFGSYGVIANNIVTRMYYFGIKLIHGASYNIVDNNNVDAAGLAGILLAGSAVAPTDCSWNQITNNIVSNIDPNGMQRGHTTACILTEQNHGTNSLPSHNIIIHNILNPGKNGSYAFFEIGPQRNEFGQNTVFQSGQINLTHGPTRSTR